MATPSTQLDRLAVEGEIREVLRQLLGELGSPAADLLRGTQAIAGLHLERDLGLGSLERVELLLRLGRSFGVHLPERVLAEADTAADVMDGVIAANGAAATDVEGKVRGGTVRSPAWPVLPGSIRQRVAALRPVEHAETLLEVIWQRGLNPATRAQTHLYLYEDGGPTADGARPVTVTHGDLLGHAAGVAQGLKARGLRAGDRVAMMLPTSRQFFFSFLGTVLAGGVPVPIYPPFRADRIEEYAARQAAILRNAGARFLITFHRAARLARLLKPRVRSLEAVLDAAELAKPADPAEVTLGRPVRGDDIAFLQYTSGSTGDPKGVTLTHANLLANIRAIGEAVAVRPGDVGIGWLPLYHDMGLIGTWLLPLYYGIPVAVMSPLAFLSRPERWLWAIHHHRGTLTAAPNFAYELCARKIADGDVAGLDLGSARAVLNGAEPVNVETMERFAERFAPYGLRREALMPVYGLAEATLAVTIPPLGRGVAVDRVERELLEREGRAVPARASVNGDSRRVLATVSCGRILAGHEIRLVDENSFEVGERTVGRLWFRGPSATPGYFRNPAASREILRGDGWVDSGDYAYRAEDDFYITGRAKDAIIKAGRNIAPQEIEEVAGAVEGIRKGCVVAFGVADARVGTERLVVVAEVRAQNTTPPNELAARVCERVAEAVGLPPDHVELVPAQSIPKTSSGKLRRSQTKQLYLASRLAKAPSPVWWQVAKLAIAGAGNAAGQRARWLLEKLYGIYAVAWFVVWLIPAWAVMRLLPSRQAVVRFTSAALRLYFRMAGMPIRVQGSERLPAGGAVLVSNHTSYFDVLVLMAALPFAYRFVSKVEVHRMPFIGSFLRRRGDFAFDRNDRQARLRQAEEVELSLRRSESVLVFPEGTFTPESGLRAFQLGAFKAAVATGRPVVPIALRGVRQILRDETILPRPGRVTLTILPPIHPRNVAGRDWHEMVRLRDLTRAAIAPHADEPLL